MCSASGVIAGVRLVASSLIAYHVCVPLLPLTDETLDSGIEETGRDFIERTTDYWHEWCSGLSLPFEWQEEVIRAAITLKLCTFDGPQTFISNSESRTATSGRSYNGRKSLPSSPGGTWTPA